MSDKYEKDVEKLLDAVIELSNRGVPLQIIIRNLLKNQAEMKYNLDNLREEFEEFKLSMEDEEDDDK